MKETTLSSIKPLLSATCTAKGIIEDLEKGKKTTLSYLYEWTVPMLYSPIFYILLISVAIVFWSLGYTWKDLRRK